MNSYVGQGFIAGAIGAVILVVIMYIMQAMGMGQPGFVAMYHGAFGEDAAGGDIAAALIFIISGGIWGAIFALLIKHPTVLKGFIFGLLPTLWLWIAVNAFIGKPLFNGFEPKGLIMPVIFNMVIWGTFVGWYLSRRSHTHYTREHAV